MPRFGTGRRTRQEQSQTVIGQIRERVGDSKVIPLISNVASNDLVLGGHEHLIRAYAEYIQYPLLDRQPGLIEMTQFKIVVDEDISDPWDLGKDYVNFVKNRLFDIAEREGVSPDVLEEVEVEFDDIGFSEFSQRLGYPRFDGPGAEIDPLLVLADLPLPIYMTTSYHGFLEAALARAGKDPRTEICRWRDGIENAPSLLDGDYEPSPSEPLVYHLYGYDEYPDSLVLTEDDYLEFLVAISRDANRQNADPIHPRLRRATSSMSLVLLGYDLHSWDFRALFWGLIKPRSRENRSFSIQLAPNEVEKSYLLKYLSEAKFDVYWGDVCTFAQELYRELNK